MIAWPSRGREKFENSTPFDRNRRAPTMPSRWFRRPAGASQPPTLGRSLELFLQEATFPATRAELVGAACSWGVGDPEVRMLCTIPDGVFSDAIAVREAIAREASEVPAAVDIPLRHAS